LARKNGQIIARGEGRWLVRVSQGRDRETGRRKYLNRTIRGGFRAAQRYLNTRLEERCKGRGLEGEGLTLNEYLDRWLELAARPKLRAKSYCDYQALFGRHVCPTLGERELRSLAPLDLQRTFHQMPIRIDVALPVVKRSAARCTIVAALCRRLAVSLSCAPAGAALPEAMRSYLAESKHFALISPATPREHS
jgi:hypothetical protein